MKLFKKTTPTKVVDNTETVVYDFKLRAPFWSYRTVPYREYEPFSGFTPEINSHLDKLFQGEIDDGNGDVLDNMICDMARQAEKDLDKQRTEHGDIIKSFDIRNRGDRTAFEHELTLLQSELLENEQQTAEIKTRLKQDKFIGGKKYAQQQ
jgi:hypothetical protein